MKDVYPVEPVWLPARRLFRFNDDGEAEAYEKVEPEYEKAAKEARDSCPVSVIDIY